MNRTFEHPAVKFSWQLHGKCTDRRDELPPASLPLAFQPSLDKIAIARDAGGMRTKNGVTR